MKMTERTSDVYPYDTSYEPMCNVPIVTGASTYTERNTGISFITFKNKAVYYGKKHGHSLIKSNQVRSWLWITPLIKTENYVLKLWMATKYI